MALIDFYNNEINANQVNVVSKIYTVDKKHNKGTNNYVVGYRYDMIFSGYKIPSETFETENQAEISRDYYLGLIDAN